MTPTVRHYVTAAGWSAAGRAPRAWYRRDGFILTALGYAALEEARAQEETPAPCCAWCGLNLEPDEPTVPAGAGRVLHDTPSCRGAFEDFTAGGADA